MFQNKQKQMCGGSVFTAARTSSSRYKSQDDTGIMMGSCRHQLIHRALNMHRGEYIPIICTNMLQIKGLSFCATTSCAVIGIIQLNWQKFQYFRKWLTT